MRDHDQARANQLDRFLDALALGAEVEPPDGLDPALAALGRTLVLRLTPPDPAPAFAERLHLQIAAAVTNRQADGPHPSPFIYMNGRNGTADATQGAYLNGAQPDHRNGTAHLVTGGKRLAPSGPHRTGVEPAAVAGTEGVAGNTVTYPTQGTRRPSWPAWLRVPRFRPARLSRRWSLAGLAVAAALLLMLSSAYDWSDRSTAVSALEIVQRAQAADRAPFPEKLQSFFAETRVTALPGSGPFLIRSTPPPDAPPAPGCAAPFPAEASEIRQWYEAPDKFRSETIFSGPQIPVPQRVVTVRNGDVTWGYTSCDNVVIRQAEPPPDADGRVFSFMPGAIAFPEVGGRGVTDINGLLVQAGACGTARLVSDGDVVAGRPAYAVDVQLSGMRCPFAPPPMNAAHVGLAVDKETFFVLRTALFAPDTSVPFLTTEVTRLEFNQPVEPASFAFTPPPGAVICTFVAPPGPPGGQPPPGQPPPGLPPGGCGRMIPPPLPTATSPP